MDATIKAMRAITAVYFRRLLTVLFVIAGLVLAVAWFLTIYLSLNISLWWWLVLCIIVPVTVVALLLSVGLWLLSSRLLPRTMTRQESRVIRAFTARLFSLAETTRMPYPFALFMIAKDVVRGRESTLLRNAINDSTTLKSDFTKIREMF